MTRITIYCTAALLLSPCCFAQYAMMEGNAPIVGTGTVHLQKPSSKLRTFIPLTAKGKGIAEAAAAIQEKVKATRLQLNALGAEKDSIIVGKLGIDDATSDMHRQMAQQMGRLGSFGGAVSTEQSDGVASMIVVRQQITADWPLTGDGTDLLVAAHKLRQSILETPFNDDGDADEELSAEELELMEEAQMFSESGEADPNQPAIMFIAMITSEERATLMKKAFAKGRIQAESLADASGTKLGKLISVRQLPTESDGGWSNYEMMERYGRAQFAAIQAQLRNSKDADLMAYGEKPTDLTFSVSVSVGFELIEQ